MKILVVLSTLVLMVSASCTNGGDCDNVCDFTGQECFEAMHEMMQVQVTADCNEVKGNAAALAELMDNLNMLCDGKHKDHLVPGDCCDHCDFSGQDCFDMMHEMMQEQIHDDCCEVYPAGYQELLDNLNMLCDKKHKDPLHDPCPDVCNRTDICIEFVVDSSGSIDDAEWILVTNFLMDFINAFSGNIAADKTRIGIIQYASNDDEIIRHSLCSGDAVALAAAVTAMVGDQEAAGEFTHTGDAILEMTEEFEECCTDDDKEKYAIVLTDGLTNGGVSVEDAMPSVPAEITTIAIGVGAANDAELLQIAKGIPANKIHVNNAGELNALIAQLLALLGC